MRLNTLSPATKRITRAPVGRGGKRGKTSGRGGKGQTARAGHKIRPEARDLIKKIPKRRGFGKNRARTVRKRCPVAPVAIAAIAAAFAAGETVSPATLLSKGLVRKVGGRIPSVKILGGGEITLPLIVERCALSETARAALAKAGATINA